jgi:hypothetical protein
MPLGPGTRLTIRVKVPEEMGIPAKPNAKSGMIPNGIPE